MKLFVKISFFFLFPILLRAQPHPLNLDSLHLVLDKAPSDTFRMKIYDQLGWAFAEINRDSALFYFEKELPIARRLNLKIYEAASLTGIGFALGQLGNSPGALESHLEAQKIASSPAAEKNPWNLTNNTWNTAHSTDPKIARLDLLGWIYSNMGILYGFTGNTDMQISYLFQAINIGSSVHDTTLMEAGNGNVGSVYFHLNKLDSALLFLQRALFLYENSDVFKKYEGNALTDIGKIYQKKGNFDLAKDALLKSIKSQQEQQNVSGLGYSYLSLADLYLAAKNTDSSMFYAQKALETYNEVSIPSGVSGAYSLLASLYSKQNKTDSAFAYLKLAAAIKDSLNNADRINLLAFKNRDFDEIMKIKKLEEEKIQTRSKVRIFALLIGIGVFILITLLLYRNNKHRQNANVLLQKQKEEIEIQKRNVEGTLAELKATQAQLIQSEKMASLGELTAGIAHEIQNPLNFVNNFSEVNTELIDELSTEVDKGNLEEVKAIAKDIKENEQKINHHGKRADAIVKGMLQHSRSSKGVKELIDINALCDEYLRLSYHGLRAKDKNFNAEIKTYFDASIGKINIAPQDIGRALLNLYNNAFYAVDQKTKLQAASYQPQVTVSTKNVGNKIQISVKDNGNGIPDSIKEKIFQPFFTTKPTGSGTGLGLSLSYDIIKAHGGEIKMETKEGEGSEFIIQLPIV
jgi:two-component system, NtrC family, sensor kinase